MEAYLIATLVVAAGLGFIPASIAKNKGYIDSNSIRRYFAHVAEKYSIVNPCGIQKYSNDMYANVR